MRRPFNTNGMGTGGMLRTVQRTLRTTTGVGGKDPFSHSTAPSSAGASGNSASRKTFKPTTGNLLSLSSYSLINQPVPVSPVLSTWPSCSSLDGSDEFEWECLEKSDVIGACDDVAFGSVPGLSEVQQAVSALQQVVGSPTFSQSIKDKFGYSSDKDSIDGTISPTCLSNRFGSELDWIEPAMVLHPYGPDKVYDAFHLLQTEPCIQRMVVSLSTDKAVWDAVLNNEVVRELRETMNEAEDAVSENLNGSSDPAAAAASLLSWILDNAKAKIMGIVDKVVNLVNELFPHAEDEKAAEATGGGDTNPFEEKLRTSFMLSIIVLLIVVVSRAHGA